MRRPTHPPAEGVLLPRILSHQQRRIPRLCTELCLNVPCAAPPLCVRGIECTSQPTWNPIGAGQLSRVSIPVQVHGHDRTGKGFCAQATVEAEVALPVCGGNQLYLLPCVQLLHAGEGCECLPVELCVTLDCYVIRLEPCWIGTHKPACPPLPLYPPPINPPNAPQCPASPGLCGWPIRG